MSPDITSGDNSKPTLEQYWLIRSCEVYQDEYRDCRAFRSRFHQYFVNGTTADCTQWKRDWDNCLKWEESRDIKAGKEIIESEKLRRINRLKPHYENKVWEKRTAPPEDWNRPLPEYMQKEYENTYLDIKSREAKFEIEPVVESKCSIM